MIWGIALLFIFLHQLLEHQAFAWVSGLCLSATDDVTTSEFVLIVSLIISLWLLWLYCWLYYFNYITLAVLLIVFVLGSVLCFWYHSHYLLFKVRAIQDMIHFLNESRMCIQLSIKIYQRNPLDHLDNL